MQVQGWFTALPRDVSWEAGWKTEMSVQGVPGRALRVDTCGEGKEAGWAEGVGAVSTKAPAIHRGCCSGDDLQSCPKLR